jgi:hypothetical protein
MGKGFVKEKAAWSVEKKSPDKIVVMDNGKDLILPSQPKGLAVLFFMR